MQVRYKKIVLFLVFVSYIQCNPCDNAVYKQIPFAERRFVKNAIDPSFGDIPLSDRELSDNWYRAGDETMPTAPPPTYSCGTIYPLWFDGKYTM